MTPPAVYRALLLALAEHRPVSPDELARLWGMFRGHLMDQGVETVEAEWRAFETLVAACEHSARYNVDVPTAAEIVWGLRPIPGSFGDHQLRLAGALRECARSVVAALTPGRRHR